MPKLNVYVSDDLAEAVKEAGIPISSVCQRALADAVETADGRRVSGDLAGGLTQLTAKAHTALTAAQQAAEDPTSVDVVEHLAPGPNLAYTVLKTFGVDPAAVAQHAQQARSANTDRTKADSLQTVLARAVDQAMEIGNNYVGCEHLLLGVLSGRRSEPMVAAFRERGVTYDAARAAVVAALAGIDYARDNLRGALSAPIRSALDEIRQRLSRLEAHKA